MRLAGRSFSIDLLFRSSFRSGNVRFRTCYFQLLGNDATVYVLSLIHILKGVPKDQYQVMLELQQKIWDGGGIRMQKKQTTAEAEIEKEKLNVDMYCLLYTSRCV